MLIKKIKSNDNKNKSKVKSPVSPLSQLRSTKVGSLYDLQKRPRLSLGSLSRDSTSTSARAYERKKHVLFLKNQKTFSLRKQRPFGHLSQNKICKLKITVYSYGKSQGNDLKHSLKKISKLFGRLNALCAQRLRGCVDSSPNHSANLAVYNLPGFNLLQHRGLASAAYCAIGRPHSLLNLKPDLSAVNHIRLAQERHLCSTFALAKARGKEKKKIDPSLSVSAADYKLKAASRPDYRNRFFFKSCEYFSINSDLFGRSLQAKAASLKLFTVTRAPFVFKKTREQFSLQKLSHSVTARLYSPVQKQLFLECASLLNLPGEFKITDY
jgi:hypothetical protein